MIRKGQIRLECSSSSSSRSRANIRRIYTDCWAQLGRFLSRSKCVYIIRNLLPVVDFTPERVSDRKRGGLYLNFISALMRACSEPLKYFNKRIFYYPEEEEDIFLYAERNRVYAIYILISIKSKDIPL